VLAVTVVLYGFVSMGMMPLSAWLRGSATALVSTGLAALAGAAVYKEA
jgi:hypothetical protein